MELPESVESDKYQINDLGFLQAANSVAHSVILQVKLIGSRFGN
jgi:hypothetical protein